MNIEGKPVFDTETVIRMGLQNSVLRKLREMGCSFLSASLDTRLTITLQYPVPAALMKQPGGWSMHKTDKGDLMAIDMDGCRVAWFKPAEKPFNLFALLPSEFVRRADVSVQS